MLSVLYSYEEHSYQHLGNWTCCFVVFCWGISNQIMRQTKCHTLRLKLNLMLCLCTASFGHRTLSTELARKVKDYRLKIRAHSSVLIASFMPHFKLIVLSLCTSGLLLILFVKLN